MFTMPYLTDQISCFKLHFHRLITLFCWWGVLLIKSLLVQDIFLSSSAIYTSCNQILLASNIVTQSCVLRLLSHAPHPSFPNAKKQDWGCSIFLFSNPSPEGLEDMHFTLFMSNSDFREWQLKQTPNGRHTRIWTQCMCITPELYTMHVAALFWQKFSPRIIAPYNRFEGSILVHGESEGASLERCIPNRDHCY